MPATRRLSVTLPEDLAEMVEAKVASGEYASEDDVIQEGLRALDDRQQTIETWLREEVLPVYDLMAADPSQGLTADQVRAALADADRAGKNR